VNEMRILERDVDGVTVLALDGPLLLEDGELSLRDAVNRLAAAGRVRIVLDLTHVTRIDSAGIGMLVSKFLTAFRGGGRLTLLHPTPRVLEMLRMTRLSSVFDIYDSEEDAVRNCAPLDNSEGG
jgi:anti-sigma B factor antagonist